MGIFDELKDLKEQLEKEQSGEEQGKEEEKVENKPTEELEKEPEKEAEPEKPAEAEKPVEKPAEEEKPLDDNGFARLRREKLAAEKLANDLRAENEALKAAKNAAPVEAETSEIPQISPELAEVIEERRYQKAGLEFNALEDGFRQKAPDYDDISNAYKRGLAQSILMQNPRLPIDAVIKEANKQLLTKASVYFNAGFDPIEEMYHEAKELINKGLLVVQKQAEVQKETPTEQKKELKPDLDKIAANKARNAGTAAAKGNGTEGQMTAGYAAGMPAKEWARLPKAEKDRILAGLG